MGDQSYRIAAVLPPYHTQEEVLCLCRYQHSLYCERNDDEEKGGEQGEVKEVHICESYGLS